MITYTKLLWLKNCKCKERTAYNTKYKLVFWCLYYVMIKEKYHQLPDIQIRKFTKDQKLSDLYNRNFTISPSVPNFVLLTFYRHNPYHFSIYRLVWPYYWKCNFAILWPLLSVCGLICWSIVGLSSYSYPRHCLAAYL